MTSRAAPLLDAYRAAVLAKDVDAFMRLYAADVRVFDTWGVWAYEGEAAWRQMAQGWFGSLGDERVEVLFDEVRATDAGALVLVTAFATYRGLSASGQPLRAMQNRLSWVLREGPEGLRVVHEHTSVPVDFDHAKAILQRPAP